MKIKKPDPTKRSKKKHKDEKAINAEIRQYYSEELEERLRKFTFGRFRSWQAERELQRVRWYISWMLYNGYGPDERYGRNQGSNVWVPEPYVIARSIAPRVYFGTFGASRNYSLEPKSESVTKRSIQSMEDLIRHFRDKCHWETSQVETVLLATIQGVCANRLEWCLRDYVTFREVADESDNMDESLIAKVKQVVETVQELNLITISANNYYQDMGVSNPQSGRTACGEDIELTWDDIREGIESKRYNKHANRVLNKLKRVSGSGSGMEGHSGESIGPHDEYIRWHEDWWDKGYEDAEKMAAGQMPYQWEPMLHEDIPNKFVAKRIQTLAPLELDKNGHPIMTWVEMIWVGPYMIRCVDLCNPLGKVDYFTFQVEPRPLGYNAHGVIEPIAGLCRELNEFNNLTMDNAALCVRGMYAIEHSAGVPGNVVRSIPGGLVRLNRIGQIKDLPKPTGFSEGMEATRWCQDKTREGSGLPKVMTGEPANKRQTGLEVTTHQEEAMFRHRLTIAWNGKGYVKPLIQHAIANIQAFMSTDEMVRVIGTKGAKVRRISRADIEGDYDVFVRDSEETANDGLAVQQAQNFMQILTNMSQLPHLTKRVDEEFDLIEMAKVIAEIMRVPMRDRFTREIRREDRMSAYQTLLHFAHGGTLDVDPTDDTYPAFIKTITTPGPDGTTPLQDFIADEDIGPLEKSRLVAYVKNVVLAAQRMEQEMMAKQMQAAAAPQDQGDGEPQPGGPPGAQEMPRTEENLAGMAGQEEMARSQAQIPGQAGQAQTFRGRQ